jgi:hypothetical protein
VEKFGKLVAFVKRTQLYLGNIFFLGGFYPGLKNYIRDHHLQCHMPARLTQAIWLARRLEQAPTFITVFVPHQPFKKVARPVQREVEPAQQNIAYLTSELQPNVSSVENLGYLAIPKFAKANMHFQSF